MANILLGEENPEVRRLLVALLEQLGHEPIVLGSGSEVPPRADLLLLEPGWPHGLDQARIARARYPALPIVYMSMLPPNARFVTLGPNTYLTKPFTLEGLNTAIETALALNHHSK